jgi:exoribonuclease-2
MFPKGASKPDFSKAPPSTDPVVNRFIQFDDEGEILLGLVVGMKKDRYLVVNDRGRELELVKQRLYLLPSAAVPAFPNSTARQEFLRAKTRVIQAESETLNVSELWSFVQDEIKLYSASELCLNYFGSDTLEKHAGLRISLIKEKVHFKRDKDGFEPRSPETVEALKRSEEAKRRKSLQREATIAFLDQRLKDPSIPFPPHVIDNIKLMSEVAAGVQTSDPARQKEAKELMHLCVERLKLPENMPMEKQAFNALLLIKQFHRDTNLSFIRHDIPVAHPAEALTEAAGIMRTSALDDFSPEERAFRVDFTRKRSFTIDDISTKDMDDALSLEQTVSGWELGIHITDVSFAVHPDTALEASARRRATSLYCADQTVNMLPESLSEGRLSLQQGSVRPCLSAILSLTPDFEVERADVVPTFIKVSERYSYEDVDRLLEEGDQTLLTLHEIASACESRRIKQGANRVHRREAVPFLEQDGTIRLLEIDEDSPARSLVAEMMVLGNSVMADFAVQHEIPALFRGQERPDDPDGNAKQSSNAPEGPAKDFSARVKLKKSTVGFEPTFHSGLGLNAYIQATSPIRRYLDLCHQRQFIAYLKGGKPWIAQHEFDGIVAEVELSLQAAQVASRETRRYWLLRYLEQRPKKKPIEGTVVRLDLKSPLVELDEVYISSFIRAPKTLKLGSRVSLIVSAVDPTDDYLRLDLLS